jgi:hypothetical protein
MNLESSFKKIFPENWKISLKSKGNYQIIDESIPSKEGYIIDIFSELNSIAAKVYFETYAKDLQEIVLAKLKDSEQTLKYFVDSFKNVKFLTRKTILEESFELNKSKIETIEFEIYFKALDIQYAEETFFEILFSFLLLIFPYETEGELEGDSIQDISIRYERNKLNRSICLAFHGYNCKACGIDMQKTYGQVASKFIHVHHIIPVSKINNSIVDPIKDLIPLCPNCHAIAHLKNPPYSLDEIKLMLNKND